MGNVLALNENLGDFLTFSENGNPLILYETVHQCTTTDTRKYTGILLRIQRSTTVYCDTEWKYFLPNNQFAIDRYFFHQNVFQYV